MTRNNNIDSFAICAIGFAFNCTVTTFGARLFIEEKAPEELKIAAKNDGSTTSRPLSEEEGRKIEDLLKRGRIKSLAAQSLKLAGAAYNAEQCSALGYDDMGDHIVIFYDTLISEASSEEEIVKLAFEYVTHELRHIEQFRWLRSHGIDPTSALQAEAGYGYGQGPLETDAWAIQKGATTPIDEAMACFLH